MFATPIGSQVCESELHQNRGTQCLLPRDAAPHCWAPWNGPATCSAYRRFYSGQDSFIPGRCQLQVLGSLPNLWSHLKSLSFLQK